MIFMYKRRLTAKLIYFKLALSITAVPGSKNSWCLMIKVKSQVLRKFYNNILGPCPFICLLGQCQTRTYGLWTNVCLCPHHPSSEFFMMLSFVSLRFKSHSSQKLCKWDPLVHIIMLHAYPISRMCKVLLFSYSYNWQELTSKG